MRRDYTVTLPGAAKGSGWQMQGPAPEATKCFTSAPGKLQVLIKTGLT